MLDSTKQGQQEGDKQGQKEGRKDADELSKVYAKEGAHKAAEHFRNQVYADYSAPDRDKGLKRLAAEESELLLTNPRNRMLDDIALELLKPESQLKIGGLNPTARAGSNFPVIASQDDLVALANKKDDGTARTAFDAFMAKNLLRQYDDLAGPNSIGHRLRYPDAAPNGIGIPDVLDQQEKIKSDQQKIINDPTLETRLADPHDQLINVSVKGSDGKPVMGPDGKPEIRQYEVHIPNGMTSLPEGTELPVVFAFDGTTANKPYTGMAVDNKINAQADGVKEGDKQFIVVYPLPKPRVKGFGITKTMRDWNAPGVGALPHDPSYNDEDYVKSVIDDVRKRFHQQEGFKAVAFSLGGEFLKKLNADLPAGTFDKEYIVDSTKFGKEGMPLAGTSVKFVFGEDDPILPLTGGMPKPPNMGWLSYAVARSFADTTQEDASDPMGLVQSYLRANGFTGSSKKVDYGSYTEETFPAAQTRSGVQIVEDVVKGAGHFWFGRERGGSHETLASDTNGFNPAPEIFDCTSDMAKWFGLSR